MAKIISLLQLLWSPVWWPYTHSVINMDFINVKIKSSMIYIFVKGDATFYKKRMQKHDPVGQHRNNQ